MTTANLRGGFVKSLTISRDGSSASDTILKSAFLKKTNNYVCQMTQFVTNITPALNQIDEVMFQILPKGDENELIADQEFDDDDWIDPSWTRFTPTPHFSLMGLAQQLELFFHKFGFLAQNLGAQYIFQADPTHYPFLKTNVVPTDQEPDSDDSDSDPFIVFDDKGWGALDDEARLVKFKLLPDGRFALEFTALFSSNFYVRVGPSTQKLTGFPEFLFVTQDNAQTYTHLDGIDQLFVAGAFTHDNDVDTNFTVESRNSFNAFDHRLTLDVVATLPLSNRITVVNGTEEHEYLLSRFPLADYKRFETDLVMSADGVSNETSITEDVNVGLEDLTRGNPDITSVFLLPGNIQQVNLQLWTRYYNDGTIDRVKTDMVNGFWSAKLLFTKKQT